MRSGVKNYPQRPAWTGEGGRGAVEKAAVLWIARRLIHISIHAGKPLKTAGFCCFPHHPQHYVYYVYL